MHLVMLIVLFVNPMNWWQPVTNHGSNQKVGDKGDPAHNEKVVSIPFEAGAPVFDGFLLQLNLGHLSVGDNW